METKHTPTPLERYVTNTYACGCKVFREHSATEARFIHYCPIHAAAPELVAALQRIFEHAYDDDTPNTDICADFDDMREIARAAIEKAEKE